MLALAGAADPPVGWPDWPDKLSPLWPKPPPKTVLEKTTGGDEGPITKPSPTANTPTPVQPTPSSTPPPPQSTPPPQTTPPPQITPTPEPPKPSPPAEVTTPPPPLTPTPTPPSPQPVASNTHIVPPPQPPLVPGASPTSTPVGNGGNPTTPINDTNNAIDNNPNTNPNQSDTNAPASTPADAGANAGNGGSSIDTAATTGSDSANTKPVTASNTDPTSGKPPAPTQPSQSKPSTSGNNELDEQPPNKSQKGKLSGGAIGGLVVGILLVLAAAVLAFFWNRNKRNRQLYNANDFEEFKGFSPDSHTNLMAATTIAGYGGDSGHSDPARDSRGYASSEVSDFHEPAAPPSVRVANGMSRARSGISFRQLDES
ncbi:hypothetical protein GGI00_000099 [Coemansia sp. RSA 2681]|nr:hypothetical protein GGI00_000099 [Coemansia sp. RSA 2681]